MNNVIKIFYSGVRYVDLGDETLDDLLANGLQENDYMDLDYFYDTYQVDLIADADAVLPVEFLE